jgi:hypothetical protein
MGSLTETAFLSRKIIRWSIFGLIGFTILRLVFFAAIDFYRVTFPPPALVPNNALGKLPKIEFPESATPSGQLSFTINTVSGTIPEASDAARVYFMPKNRSNLLSLSRAQVLVNNVGFNTTPRQIGDTNAYHWIDLRNPLRSIDLDIVTGQFQLKYAYIHELTLFNQPNIPPPVQATNQVLAFFRKMGITAVDLDFDNPQVTYLRLVGNSLEPTTSQSQANAVRVDVFRKPYSNYPVYTDKLGQANVSFIISGAIETNKDILEVNFHHWEVDERTMGIYALKQASTAYTELQSGQAYFVSLPPDNNVVITDVFLAYYDSKMPQLFLQPVFVFTGENGFMAYVPAVAPPWTE